MTKEKKFFVVGLVLLVVGLLITFLNPNNSADNLAIAQQANDAQAAAQAIASNNQSEVLINTVGMFLLGIGLGLSVVTGIKLLLNKNK